eukprot:TRINITY_DN1175_c0_g2_i6.p1 TRINITY_DN1175_c0_g2~~TRINITY_DN1175_c0_g2_i6.p1  ORF type:complete len:205 (+),score=4.40 TRINITY_DN1175_c0_g2_i6:387-1001(+)
MPSEAGALPTSTPKEIAGLQAAFYVRTLEGRREACSGEYPLQQLLDNCRVLCVTVQAPNLFSKPVQAGACSPARGRQAGTRADAVVKTMLVAKLRSLLPAGPVPTERAELERKATPAVLADLDNLEREEKDRLALNRTTKATEALNLLSVPQLRSFARKKNVTIPARSTKQTIVGMLVAPLGTKWQALKTAHKNDDVAGFLDKL